MQFYTGNFLDGTLTGKGGRVYGASRGLLPRDAALSGLAEQAQLPVGHRQAGAGLPIEDRLHVRDDEIGRVNFQRPRARENGATGPLARCASVECSDVDRDDRKLGLQSAQHGTCVHDGGGSIMLSYRRGVGPLILGASFLVISTQSPSAVARQTSESACRVTGELVRLEDLSEATAWRPAVARRTFSGLTTIPEIPSFRDRRTGRDRGTRSCYRRKGGRLGGH